MNSTESTSDKENRNIKWQSPTHKQSIGMTTDDQKDANPFTDVNKFQSVLCIIVCHALFILGKDTKKI
jgi:hypothetical protein